MSISPIVVGRLLVSLLGLLLPCFHTKCVPIPPELSAQGYRSAVGLSGQLVFLTLVGRGYQEEWAPLC